MLGALSTTDTLSAAARAPRRRIIIAAIIVVALIIAAIIVVSNLRGGEGGRGPDAGAPSPGTTAGPTVTTPDKPSEGASETGSGEPTPEPEASVTPTPGPTTPTPRPTTPSATPTPGAPLPPPGRPLSVTATPGDGILTVTVVPGALNGNRAEDLEYEYQVLVMNGPGVSKGGVFPGSGGGVITGLNNGTSYRVQVFAINKEVGDPGEPRSSANATPYGTPIISNITVTRQHLSVLFEWTVNANGAPLKDSTYGVPPSGGSGSYLASGLNPGQSAPGLVLVYGNKAGTDSTVLNGKALDGTIVLSRGPATLGNGANGCSSGDICYPYLIDANYLKINTNYTAACYRNGSSSPFHTQTVTTNAEGRWWGSLACLSVSPGSRASIESAGDGGGTFSNIVDFTP